MSTRNVGTRAGIGLVGLVGVALLLGGCAGLKPPTLTVDTLKMGDMGVTGATLEVGFKVRNPNPDPLLVKNVEYEMELNGRRLGRGYVPDGFELIGFGEKKIESDFNVNFLSVPGAVKRVLDRDRVKAKVKGIFYVLEGDATKRLKFSADAELKLNR